MPVLVTSQQAPVAWTLRTPSGSVAEYSVTLELVDGSPYPVDGATWEYVVRPPLFQSGEPLFSVTTTANSSGLITVETSPATVVSLTLYPAATVMLAGAYRHGLWMNPGTTGAFSWLTGSLQVTPAAQP